ncbi:MAG: ABC transporter permease [Mucilaginibacter sp.]
MFKNYFKIAWRNISRDISYSAINMIGLAVGLSSFIVILLYMNYELSYDKWAPELKNVYRVSLQTSDGEIREQTPAPLGAFLAQKYPNAEAATSIQPSGDFEMLVAANNKAIYQKDIVEVDSAFFRVFPYKLVKGDVASALNNPKAAVLTEELAGKLFGEEDPIGKSIKVYNTIDCVVTGVMEEPKGPSHLVAKMLMVDQYRKGNNFWGNFSFQTYLRVKQPEAEVKVENAIDRLYFDERIKPHVNKSFDAYRSSGKQAGLFVDAVGNIHNFPKHGASNFKTVSVLMMLAFLLLLAGAINFSNLAIAKSMRRAKEVGVRKVLGSNRKQLIYQFMTETAVQCLISLGIAVALIYIALPYVNHTFNLTLGFLHQQNTWSLVAQIGACLTIVTLLSGLYPSLFLSRFNTTRVLKGDYSSGKQGGFFRNGLIVVQFMVSVFFIGAILVINGQMDYMQNKDKGFSGEQVMRIQATQKSRDANFQNVVNSLLTIPGVSYISKTTKVPGDRLSTDTATVGFKYEGKDYRMASVKVSTDYFKTLKIGLVAGRMFTNETNDQNTRTAIINESAARKLNLTDPVGKIIAFPSCDSVPVRVVGVVKDFAVQGFENAVQPEVYTIGNKACMFQSGGAILVKLNSAHLQSSVAAIDQAWKQIEPGFPIRYSFLDENFQQLLSGYQRLQKIIAFFAVVAITISVMGLFALTAFFTRQRTKEIGVRKILGASVAQLTALLSKEFVYLVLLSVVIITPVSWLFLQKWLQTFAYHITITWWLYVAAGCIAILIALITISFQSIKAALANPVKNLRSE